MLKQVKEKTKKGIQLTLFQFIVIMALSILTTAFLTYAYVYVQSLFRANVISAQTPLPERLVNGLSNSYGVLKRTYMGDIDEEKLIDGALAGFVSGVGDEYTSYMNAQELEGLEQMTNSSFEGVGIEIEPFETFIRVVSPIDNAPAEKAGIQSGDVIIGVDGEDTSGKNTTEMAKLIRGPKGTSVTIKVRRGSQEFEVSLTRDTIPLTSVTVKMSTEHSDTGIIRISSFAEKTYDELVEGVKSLRQSGAKRFVVDVRSNPGGLVEAVEKIANAFLPKDATLFKLEDKEQGVKTVVANEKFGTFRIDEPTVVLMDKGSASASEIFSAALSQNHRAKLVGEKTFGKGTAQTVYPLSDDTAIKVTFSKWLTPNGEWVHKKGVEPDVEVPLPDYTKLLLVDTAKPLRQSPEQLDTVLNLQKVLKTLGFDVQLTSVFDESTVNGVKAFQKAHNLSVTGEVDSQTAQKLNEVFKAYKESEDPQLKKAMEFVRQ